MRNKIDAGATVLERAFEIARSGEVASVTPDQHVTKSLAIVHHMRVEAG